MKKISKIFLILIFIIIAGVQIVNASSKLIPIDVKETLDSFFNCLDDGDEDVYNYIDSSNTELSNNIQTYLNSISIKYQITDINKENDTYFVEAKIAAQGINWNVSGFTTKYELKQINGEYKIINTDLFNVIGSDNVFAFVFKILAIVFGVIFTIIAIIVTIVIICVKKSKKKCE